MKLFVFINRFSELTPRQTTALLIAAAANHGVCVEVAEFDTLHFSSNNNCFSCHAVSFNADGARDSEDVAHRVATESTTSHLIATHDHVWIRTNPGRDGERKSQHQSFLSLCRLLAESGVQVCNAPMHLDYFASKSSLQLLSVRFRPRMTCNPTLETALQFVEESEKDCVIKPDVGSRGLDVLKIHKNQEDLKEVLSEKIRMQPMVIQEFVKAADEGDRRVIVLDGEVLKSNERFAGIHRIPADGDFRANLHAGGSANPLSLNRNQVEAAQSAARLLAKHGIRLAGVDLIGDQIIEFNVFSTGGLYDCQRFTGINFAEKITSSLLKN